MSTCNLSTHEQYPLNSVQFDKGTGKLAVHLSNPPQATCPDGFFTSKAATLTVDPNISVATLTYTNHPVVLVPSKGIVQEIDSTPPSSFPFGTLVVLALIGVAIYGYFKGWYSSWFNTPAPATPTGSGPSGSSSTFTPSTPAPVSSSTDTISARSNDSVVSSGPAPIVGGGYRRGGTVNASRPAAPPVNHTVTASAPVGQTVVQTVPQTVVVHDNGMGNFVGGMLVGQALSGGFDHHHDTVTTEVIHDREIVHDRDSYRGDNGRDSYRSDRDDSYRSDNTPSVSSDDDSSSRYSSDDSSSSSRYSSDDSSSSSSSSYSSDDSSSSYSSDSGSSYSSDSGSSFSSDSGSSFGGD